MHVHTDVHTCAHWDPTHPCRCAHFCMHAYPHSHICVHMHTTCVCTCPNEHVFICAHMHAHAHTALRCRHMQAPAHMHTYTFLQTCTHALTHVHRDALAFREAHRAPWDKGRPQTIDPFVAGLSRNPEEREEGGLGVGPLTPAQPGQRPGDMEVSWSFVLLPSLENNPPGHTVSITRMHLTNSHSESFFLDLHNLLITKLNHILMARKEQFNIFQNLHQLQKPFSCCFGLKLLLFWNSWLRQLFCIKSEGFPYDPGSSDNRQTLLH